MEIRAATRADVAAMMALWAGGRSDHASVADSPEAVERLLRDFPGALFVAEADGEVVGALIAAWDGWRGNMYRLAVATEWRRRGIGLDLVRAGEQSLRERGALRVTALVAFEDEDACGFWDAAGYPSDPVIGRRARNL